MIARSTSRPPTARHARGFSATRSTAPVETTMSDEMREIATIVSPNTILVWHRRLIAGNGITAPDGGVIYDNG